MSLKAMGWAFEQPLSGNEKCVLLALAERARDEDGLCWPGQAEVAHKAYVSTKTVGRIMKKLEDAGYLRREARYKDDGSRKSDLTWLQMDRPSPTDTLGGPPTAGGTPRTEVSVEPSKEPSVGREGAGERGRVKIGGKPVKVEAWEMTENVLASFNEQAGTKLRLLTSAGQPSEAAKRIYGRVVLYPDITLGEHADIIKRTLASKWWGDGHASPGVVYGPKVFEDNITRKPTKNADAAKAERDARRRASIDRLTGRNEE
jgi:hypothetical protein